MSMEDKQIQSVKSTVIEQLKEHYSINNIEVEEFETRLEAANMTENKEVLLSLLSDLPTIQNNTATNIEYDRKKVKSSDTLFTLLGGTERRGMWRPARRIKSFTMLGGTDIDLSEAIIPSEGIEIEAFCMLGGLDIIVPDNVHVDVTGIPILGGVDNRANSSSDPSAPLIKIRAFCMLGGIDVKNKKKRKGKK